MFKYYIIYIYASSGYSFTFPVYARWPDPNTYLHNACYDISIRIPDLFIYFLKHDVDKSSNCC